MWLFKKAIADGSPYIDYKEASKTGPYLQFIFKVDEFTYFILREICVTYPCDATAQRSQLPIYVDVVIVSTQNQIFPVPVQPNLFSSPSQNFRSGTLNEDPQGQRLQPFTFNFACDMADYIRVTISGTPVDLLFGCMLSGRRYLNEWGKRCR